MFKQYIQPWLSLLALFSALLVSAPGFAGTNLSHAAVSITNTTEKPIQCWSLQSVTKLTVQPHTTNMIMMKLIMPEDSNKCLDRDPCFTLPMKFSTYSLFENGDELGELEDDDDRISSQTSQFVLSVLNEVLNSEELYSLDCAFP